MCEKIIFNDFIDDFAAAVVLIKFNHLFFLKCFISCQYFAMLCLWLA